MHTCLATLLLCLIVGLAEARGGGGGVLEADEGIRANCTTQLMSAQMGHRLGLSGLPCVFPRKLVVLGASGTGKSPLANSFLGWRRPKRALPFPVGHGVVAGTTSSAYASGPWLGMPDSPGVTLVDSPGFNSSISDMEELVWLLADLRQVDLFVVTFKYGDRFSPELGRSLTTISKLLGSIWRHTVIVVTFWSNSPHARALRKERKVNKKRYAAHLSETVAAKVEIDFQLLFELQLPVVFIDSHHDTKEGKEVREFSRETSTLWRILQNSRPWESVTKPQLESAILDVKKKFGELHEKCDVVAEERELVAALQDTNMQMIEAQKGLIRFLRRQIDVMKKSCL